MNLVSSLGVSRLVVVVEHIRTLRSHLVPFSNSPITVLESLKRSVSGYADVVNGSTDVFLGYTHVSDEH